MNKFHKYLEMIGGPLRGLQIGSARRPSGISALDQINYIDQIVMKGATQSLRRLRDEIEEDFYHNDADDWEEFIRNSGQSSKDALEGLKAQLKKADKNEYNKLAEKFGW